MGGGVHVAPQLLTEPAQLANRQSRGRLERLGEQDRYFLCNRAALAFRARFELAIERIRQVLHIQRRHMSSIFPPFWRSRAEPSSSGRDSGVDWGGAPGSSAGRHVTEITVSVVQFR